MGYPPSAILNGYEAFLRTIVHVYTKECLKYL